ncbi:MAG: LysR family transcriptional regulator [Bradymonadia bacterium]
MWPDPESLRCFLEAANLLNFRAASGRVHLSPAAFSERIKALEGLIGAPLFTRTTRSVKLTGAGQRLIPLAREALAAGQRCLEVGQSDGPAPVTLTLGTRYELGMSWLTPSLSQLSTEAPHRHLHLIFGDTPALMRALQRGEADAIVTSHRLSRGDLTYVSLHLERYVFVATPELLSARPLTCPAEAEGHTLLDISPDLPLFRYFLDARPPVEVWGFTAMSYMGTIGAVRARILEHSGVAVLPLYFVEADIDAGRLTRLCPETMLQQDYFRLIWRRGHRESEALTALGERLSTMPLC